MGAWSALPGVLVLKKEDQAGLLYLTAAEEHRATIERVRGFYADSCPIACSIKESIEISSELEFTPAQKSSEKITQNHSNG